MAVAAITFLTLMSAGGTLLGRVVYPTPVAAPETLEVRVNRPVCGRTPIVSERLLVAQDGGVANAVVSVVGVQSEGVSHGVSKLEQEGCVFRPHVQSVVVGSTLDIGNSDSVIHNVHARIGARTIFNLGMPIPGLRVKRTLDEPGVVSIVCDSGHNWMSAYVVVVPHRFHQTTSADGRFAMRGVPSGRHVVRAWHESLGVREQIVDVADGQTTEISFDFAKTAEPPRPPIASVAPAATSTGGTAVAAHDEVAVRALMRGAYESHCATCHGVDGDGAGATSVFLDPAPRDFRLGVYKFRTTASGELPTEEDLFRTISLGIPGTEMPGFRRRLEVSERRMLARFVMTFSSRFRRGATPRTIPLPMAPPEAVADVARGRSIYDKLQCAQCHGINAVIDTAENTKMLDDWEHAIVAPDLRSDVLKGGESARALYRTLTTGLDGTPMASFEEMLSPDERWALVGYLRSLRRDR